MYFNCSFPRNFTAEQDCCDYAAQRAIALDFSTDNSTAFCSTRNGTGLTSCLAKQHRIFASECLVQDVARNVSAVEASSARRGSSTSFLTRALLVVIGLSSLMGVSAASDSKSTVCKEFAPADRASWTSGKSEPVLVTEVYDCSHQDNPCEFTAHGRPEWRVSWNAPEGLEVKADPNTLADAMGDNSAAVVKLPELYDHMYYNLKGHMVANALTTITPGTFRQCDDGKEYNGSASVPRTDTFSLQIVDGEPKQHLSNAATPTSPP